MLWRQTVTRPQNIVRQNPDLCGLRGMTIATIATFRCCTIRRASSVRVPVMKHKGTNTVREKAVKNCTTDAVAAAD